MSIGPFVISLPRLFLFVGVMVAFGAAAVALREQARTKGSAVLWTSILSGAAAARAGYVLTRLDYYRENLLEVLYVWDGGLNALPGIAVTLIVAAWLSVRRGVRWTRVLASLLIGMSTWGLLHIAHGMHGEQSLPLADTTLQNLNGTTIALRSFAGKPVVLNLWATWCPPCRREMPVLAAAQAGHEDVHFVFANQNEAVDDVRRFLAAEQLSIHNVLLDRGSLAVEYDTPALPTTLFFDRNGRLKRVHMGELSAPKLADYLNSITGAGVD